MLRHYLLFKHSDPAAGLPAGTLGTVTVTDIAGGVTIDVSLISGVNFVNTGGPHTPFTYNLDGSPTPTGFTFALPLILFEPIARA